MAAAFSVILDLLVLGCLGATIYYAHRLTQSLNVFRRTRQEMDVIMRALGQNIDEAQDAIKSLRRATEETSKNLGKSLSDSRAIASELEILNQASQKIADRLDGVISQKKGTMREPEMKEYKKPSDRAPGFMIVDRDFEEPDAEPQEPTTLASQAERDLYEALNRGRGRG
jgi:hypothetical protein